MLRRRRVAAGDKDHAMSFYPTSPRFGKPPFWDDEPVRRSWILYVALCK